MVRATRAVWVILCACSYLDTAELYGAPAGTAFTYEGQLGLAGNPRAGYYDITFSLYDAALEGAQIGPTLSNTFVIGSNGVFMATLDFGLIAFNGEARWLELAVRTNGNGAFTLLSPRQQVTPAPYALQAAKAGQVAATNIVGTLASSQLPSSLGLSNISIGFATITNAAMQSLSAGRLSGTNVTFHVGADTNVVRVQGAGTTNANQTYYFSGPLLDLPGYCYWTNAANNYVFASDGVTPFISQSLDDAANGNVLYSGSYPLYLPWFSVLGHDLPPVVYFGAGPNALTVEGPMVVEGPLTADGSRLTNVPVSGVSGLTNAIKDRLGWVDVVRDFGAVGDGIHDDTTNFQNALNYIFSGPTASSQTLFIPANRGSSGRYRIEGDLVIPQQQYDAVHFDGIHIRGEGKGLSRLSFVTAGCAGIVMTNDNYFYKAIYFEDLLLLGPQQNGYNAADNSTGLRIGSYVGIYETYEIQVRDCEFVAFATALTVSNSWHPRILRNTFLDNSKTAILLSGVHCPDVQDNMISGFTSQENVYEDKGIWISIDQGGSSGGGDDGLFINNTIGGCTNAIQNDGDEGIVVLNSHIEICASYYTATNVGVDTVLQGCYILQQGFPELEAQRPGALNLCADALARLTMIQVMFDGYNLRPQIDVASDPNNIGYIPPVIIGGRGAKTVRFLGNDKLALPLLSRGTGMTNDSLMILSNTPAAWPVAPPYPGASDVVNSNGLPYLRLSTNGSGGVGDQWTATNRLGW